MKRNAKLEFVGMIIILISCGLGIGILTHAVQGELDSLVCFPFYIICISFLLLFKPFDMVAIKEHVGTSAMMGTPLDLGTSCWIGGGFTNFCKMPFVARLLVLLVMSDFGSRFPFAKWFTLTRAGLAELILEVLYLSYKGNNIGVS